MEIYEFHFPELSISQLEDGGSSRSLLALASPLGRVKRGKQDRVQLNVVLKGPGKMLGSTLLNSGQLGLVSYLQFAQRVQVAGSLHRFSRRTYKATSRKSQWLIAQHKFARPVPHERAPLKPLTANRKKPGRPLMSCLLKGRQIPLRHFTTCT